MPLSLRYGKDVREFRAHVESFLAEREAENNLPLGILAGIADGRQTFSDQPPMLVSVEAESGIELVALRTPPLNIVLSSARNHAAVAFLASRMHAEGHQLPGVTALAREADLFADEWSKLTGTTIRRAQSQRVYRLDRVNPLQHPVEGQLRACDASDRELVDLWLVGFNRDVGEGPVQASAARFIATTNAGIFFWIDQRPVAMAGFSGPTPNGIRIGPVYTPPELRGRGYASAAVAALSQRLLDGGRKFCFLYTDLANPTSNSIYQAIGYRPVCDASMLIFEKKP